MRASLALSVTIGSPTRSAGSARRRFASRRWRCRSNSSVNVAFPDIVNSFHLAVADIQWVVISYTLTYAALMLVAGRAGDLFGHRPIFLIGCAASAFAFLFCTIAPTYGWLLVARVLQGIAAALSLSCGPALITALYPEDQRTRVLGLYTLVFGVGGALGPLLGGPLVQSWGWPAVYAFRIPIALVALAMGLVLPTDSKRLGGSFDVTGATLLVTAIAALLLALNQLQHAENLLALVALFALFVVLGAAFIVQQRRSMHPVVDLKYFRSADFDLLNIGSMILNLGAFAIWLFVPFYLDRIAKLPLGAIGLVLALAPVGTAIAAPIAGRFAAKMNARRLAVAGAVAVAAGGLLIGIDVGGITLLAIAALLQGTGPRLLSGGVFRYRHRDVARRGSRRRRLARHDDTHAGHRDRRHRADAGVPAVVCRCGGWRCGRCLGIRVGLRWRVPLCGDAVGCDCGGGGGAGMDARQTGRPRERGDPYAAAEVRRRPEVNLVLA